MSIHVNDSGTYKQANNVFVKDGGVWKDTKEIWVKDDGVWKRAHLRYVDLTIAANTTNYNIYDATVAAGWDQTSHISANVIVNSGVVVSSDNSASQWAISTGSSWPSGSEIKIYNSGTIVGRGGDGGFGASAARPGFRPPGSDGVSGGGAIRALRSLTIHNFGTIAGGGGGGGGGGGQVQNNPPRAWAGGGGGGGRSSNFNSTGGAGGNGGTPGGAGTFTAAGLGSVVVYEGGDGGGWGAAGFAGQAAQYGNGTGGSAGRYVDGISNVSFVVTGTRLGGTT